MHGKTISQLYFYLISAFSLVFVIIGIYNAITFGVNISQFEKYPLQYGGEERCAYNMLPQPVADLKNQVSVDGQTKQNEICLSQLEHERKQHKVTDIKNAITFTLIGIVLFSIHFPIALKRSKN